METWKESGTGGRNWRCHVAVKLGMNNRTGHLGGWLKVCKGQLDP